MVKNISEKQLEKIETQIKLYKSAQEITKEMLKLLYKKRENENISSFKYDDLSTDIHTIIQSRRIILGELCDLDEQKSKIINNFENL